MTPQGGAAAATVMETVTCETERREMAGRWLVTEWSEGQCAISRETCRIQIVDEDRQNSSEERSFPRVPGPGDACCHRQGDRNRNTRFLGGSGRQESEPS